jgi:hypothetical protein
MAVALSNINVFQATTGLMIYRCISPQSLIATLKRLCRPQILWMKCLAQQTHSPEQTLQMGRFVSTVLKQAGEPQEEHF